MNRTGLWIPILMLALLAACGGGGGTEEAQATGSQAAPANDEATGAADDPVSLAVEIAEALEADPDSAEAILERHGLTVEQYEALMYDISADPELSRAYEAALAE